MCMSFAPSAERQLVLYKPLYDAVNAQGGCRTQGERGWTHLREVSPLLPGQQALKVQQVGGL